MKHYAFYDRSGNVVASTTCDDDALPPVPPGLFMLETAAHHQPESVYVANGSVRAKPQKPSYPARFSTATGTWSVDMDAAWAEARAKRNSLIAACDWVTLPDVPLSTEEREAWTKYRQALRDITQQPNPTAITWPVPPGKQ